METNVVIPHEGAPLVQHQENALASSQGATCIACCAGICNSELLVVGRPSNLGHTIHSTFETPLLYLYLYLMIRRRSIPRLPFSNSKALRILISGEIDQRASRTAHFCLAETVLCLSGHTVCAISVTV
jgi:hypothetical protein